MKKKISLLLTIFLAFGSAAFAGVEIIDPWVRASTSPNTALYVKIINTSPTPDKLINVTTNDSVRSELHSHEENNGVMQMKKVGFIEIPSKGNTVLESGKHHIMLMQLNRPLQDGDNVAVIFHFEQAGAVEHTVPVRAM
jgi:copper(I)-binding protein